jgi:TrmH family RNA methyltransferase
MSESVLSRVRVVLFEPQNPVNIASVVRAMKNMGVSSLRLVRPVEYDPYRLEGIAHDTSDIIERIEQFDDLDAALADCVHVAAYTARRRAAKWAVTDPHASAATILGAVADGPAAILFGREDRGLPNAALDRAHVVVNIPTTEHASLNLAQAVLVALSELHLAAGDATRTIPPPREDAPPATAEQFERLFADASRALEAIAFFKTRFPEHIMRTVRSLAFRAAPDAREIELVRAMCIEVVRAMERERKKHGPPAGHAEGAAPAAPNA